MHAPRLACTARVGMHGPRLACTARGLRDWHARVLTCTALRDGGLACTVHGLRDSIFYLGCAGILQRGSTSPEG